MKENGEPCASARLADQLLLCACNAAAMHAKGGVQNAEPNEPPTNRDGRTVS